MIYIQIHFTSHGIGYTGNILGQFFIEGAKVGKELVMLNCDQEKLSSVFEKNRKGWTFDHVYYLHADQEVFDELSTVAYQSRENIFLKDELIKEMGFAKDWKEIIGDGKKSITEEIKLIEKTPALKKKGEILIQQYWRNIQHYTISDQLLWFKKYSKVGLAYNKKFTEVNLTSEYGLDDLRDHLKIADALAKCISSIETKHKDEEYIINVSLGSYETQLAWFVLAERDVLPSNTRFISSYDNKRSTNTRFKNIDIKEVPTQLFKTVTTSLKLFEQTKSEKRKLAKALIEQHIKMEFSILILGERGVGKSRLAQEHARQEHFVTQNCAAFDDDSKAESALFGYEKGAFTGANKYTPGLFQEANGGTLFLDEVHHLSKVVQGKLMKALQTDSENNYKYIPLGSTKERMAKFTAIFASNLHIDELKQRLLPDFYDRISQLIIEIPSLRETKEDREVDWSAIWKQMKFGEEADGDKILKEDKSFASWLRNQKLFGNYRDLQKIAILYQSYLRFPKETKELLAKENGYKCAFDYVTKEYQKYYLANANSESDYLNTNMEPSEMLDMLRKDIVTWAENTYGSIPEAYQNFRKLNTDTPTAKTLYDWKKIKLR